MTHWREAGRSDVPAIVALLRDDVLGRNREDGDMGAYLAAFDRIATQPDNLLIVGQRDDRVIACYQITFIDGLSLQAARRALIEGVRVAADLRGHGVGDALMQDAEARARAAGCRLLQLTTNRTRGEAHRFYHRLGFTASHIGFKKPL
ncbi:GNAT family N-acetyltransferase [uncultured Paracoccus sp.]|uniref:GNAT family N-acetyltransferase n=1 Tax=uncultured Paracoccus sp. TaxID=189685 RepID=UPI00262479D5|nr:GNAT family N-acetyltransferase [uncultured Paracoccus sp.]